MDFMITAKNIVKHVASPALDLCGVYDSLLARKVFCRPTWLILMYHRIIDDAVSEPFQLGMCVRRRHFEEQVRYHVERFTPISLEDGAERIRSGRALPRNAVSFTFDDGYKDFQTNALPVLKRYDAPSTVYITTHGLSRDQSFWWDRVVNAFALTNEYELDIGFLSPHDTRRTLSLHPLRRRRSLLDVKELLWRQPADRLEELVDELRAALRVHDDGPLHAPRLQSADIEALARENVELAAHCDVHVDLRQLPPQRVRHEIGRSREILRELTGQSVNGFAYPGGRHDSVVRQVVAHAGFTYAVGTDRGINRQPYETFNLRRIGMPNIGVSDYKRCLISAAESSGANAEPASVTWP